MHTVIGQRKFDLKHDSQENDRSKDWKFFKLIAAQIIKLIFVHEICES